MLRLEVLAYSSLCFLDASSVSSQNFFNAHFDSLVVEGCNGNNRELSVLFVSFCFGGKKKIRRAAEILNFKLFNPHPLTVGACVDSIKIDRSQIEAHGGKAAISSLFNILVRRVPLVCPQQPTCHDDVQEPKRSAFLEH